MKHKIFIVLFIATTALTNAQNHTAEFFKKADSFFKSYVDNGKVVYQKLADDDSDLKEIIEISNQISIDIDHKNLYKSFWINVYNLGVIEQVVENYPVNSPMAIPGFFDGNKRYLGGIKITLNDIENKLLRANFKEPRFHFVLVCGAVSCPPIVNYAYTPEQLENQLATQTKLALNNSDFIRNTNGKTAISEIFSWYKEDFGTSKNNIVTFINKYRTQKINTSFDYYAYNWQLNGQNSAVKTKENTSTALSNIQTFTPSKLLAKGQFDVKWFNSVYTQTRQTLGESSEAIDIPRQSFFTSTLEFYYGVSKNARINVGFITQARANTYGDANTLSVFNFKDNGNGAGTARSGFTTFAPSIRVQPIASVPNFSFTSSLYLPIFEKDKAGYLDKNSTFWETKFFFDKTFGGNQWQIFTEVDLGFNFGDKGGNEQFANNSLGLPVSAFLSYFPTNKSTIFVNAQQFFLISFGNDFEQNYTSVGLGGKYQVTDKLNLEASVGKFVRGYNFQGLGQTFSLGLRYLSAN
ncbi:DUF547 domain-containing protein [Wenyingzhuangia aestuarii]|uniref:DUF547 domain-containing protein n=1 Tax=Wenyingzhuangia aestuarii TaxID=1647582 RepID=UPI001FD823CC|nr:DUF547 domain-containing protein [Wenyingzhuangia aestuarii]NJB83093.1 hypothetical protein [Wenyingzhuangia aestuarii]